MSIDQEQLDTIKAGEPPLLLVYTPPQFGENSCELEEFHHHLKINGHDIPILVIEYGAKLEAIYRQPPDPGWLAYPENKPEAGEYLVQDCDRYINIAVYDNIEWKKLGASGTRRLVVTHYRSLPEKAKQ